MLVTLGYFVRSAGRVSPAMWSHSRVSRTPVRAGPSTADEEDQMAKREATSKKRHSTDHTLIGYDVWFRGRVWRVVSAHGGDNHGSPWLTLKRGLGIEALAKTYEVQEALN